MVNEEIIKILSTTSSTTIRDENSNKFTLSLKNDDEIPSTTTTTTTSSTATVKQDDHPTYNLVDSCYKLRRIESNTNEKTETTTNAKVESSTTDTNCLWNCNSW